MIVRSLERLRERVRRHRQDVARQAIDESRRSRLIAVGIVAVSTLWIVSGVVSGEDAPTGGEPGAPTEASAVHVPVRVAPSRAEAHARDLIVKGATAAARKITLRAEIAGRVTEVAAAKGAALADGGAILRIDTAERADRLFEAEALVKQRDLEYKAAAELGAKNFASPIRVSTAKAQLDAAKAMQSLTRKELSRTVVRAPYAGVLADRVVELGDYVKVGDALGTVVVLDPIKIVASVTEKHVGALAPGGAATAVLLDGRRISGTIGHITPVADPKTRTFAVEIVTPNPDGAIQDGLTAEIVLSLATVPAHRISPAVLTLNDAGVVGVKTVEDGDVVRFHPIEIIADGHDGMWVSGLPENIRLITVGQEYVADGQVVAPVADPGK